MIINLSNSDKVAVIDDNDFEKVSDFTWWYSNGYASSGYYQGNRKIGRKWIGVRMQRLILNAPREFMVDHINQDKLDNRRSNLRLSTNKENCRNMRQEARKVQPTTSSFKGVVWDAKRSRWAARIMVDYRNIFLGRYEHEIHAAQAYNAAALDYFGEFASLNKLDPGELAKIGDARRPFDRRKLHRALTIEQFGEARRLRGLGHSYPEIANILNLPGSKQSVRQAIIRSDYYSPEELAATKGL